MDDILGQAEAAFWVLWEKCVALGAQLLDAAWRKAVDLLALAAGVVERLAAKVAAVPLWVSLPVAALLLALCVAYALRQRLYDRLLVYHLFWLRHRGFSRHVFHIRRGAVRENRQAMRAYKRTIGIFGAILALLCLVAGTARAQQDTSLSVDIQGPSQAKMNLVMLLTPVALGAFAGYYLFLKDAEKPRVSLSPEATAASLKRPFILTAADDQSGIRSLVVTVTQGQRRFDVLRKVYDPPREQVSEHFTLGGSELRGGSFEMQVAAADGSYANLGTGNTARITRKMRLDTSLPAVKPLTPAQYMLDIHTVGAGGGSLAWLDAGGALRVGPESAGAVPGPACYGRGEDLTVTDANLFLGRLAPDHFLGGAMVLPVLCAFRAARQRQ